MNPAAVQCPKSPHRFTEGAAHIAEMAQICVGADKPYYLALRQRGLSATAAFVALGRKLERVCFALLKNGTEFSPDLRTPACATT